ncbi:MAG TPA: hypothetical protein VIN60_05005 [Anaerolineales bacterium]
MRKESFFVILFAFVAVGCSSRTMATIKEFPLLKGTRWVYSYRAYQPSISNPRQIARATYQLTDTVTDTEFVSPYFIAHVQSVWKLVQSDSGWMEDFISNQPNETWYVVNGQQVFGSKQAIDIKNINTDDLLLDYDFPLVVNKNWCPMKVDFKDPTHKIANCQSAGKREITNQSTLETPAGKFDNCYDMVDYFNDGNFYQKFCNGVGIVSLQFDHAGTPFGFEQTLTHFSAGAQ